MLKTLTRIFSALAVVAVTAISAHALVFPPGTVGGSQPGPFPDTLNVANVQDPLAVPHPATLDTVLGVGGIITGFDAKPTGFAFYIQTSTSGTTPNAYTGIDVFTGSFNFASSPFNLAVGDSVIVYGRVQEFPATNGGTEIEGLDGSQGTQDLAFRKISSGNALPPFYVGNVNNLRELPTNPNGELWEGMLVRITTQMRVARTVGVGNNSFLVVDNSIPVPTDSVFIDGNTLTTFAAPALGVLVDAVQGIYEQRARGYRIQLRDGNDITLATPPNLVDAYSISETQVRVIFDRNVTTASATNVANYSLGSLGDVNAAVMDGQNRAILTVANASPHGVAETVNAVNIVGLANGLTQTATQSRTFIMGVLTAEEVQRANPDSLLGSPCVDRSRYAGAGGQTSQGAIGPRMSLSGTVVGNFTPLYYLTDDAQGLRSGVSAFAPLGPMTVNDRYLYVGAVQEFFGESEVTDNVYLVNQGAGFAYSAIPATIAEARTDTCDVTNALTDGEDLEGMLVKLSYVRKVRRVFADGTGNLPGNGFHVQGPIAAATDTIFIQNLNGVLGASTAADSTNPNYQTLGNVLTITGVVHYAGNTFRVCPRNGADIINHGNIAGVPTEPAQLTFGVHPNPARRATLSFTLPRDADIELGIFDVSGRKVVELAKGSFPAGSYTKGWAGRGSDGTQVPAGVYFARLRVGQDVRSVRTVLLGQ